jgi:macrolide-specific efflux system membrane fusion protein
MTVQKGDSASASTVIATLLTHAKVAQLTLNEVDAAKVKVDQKATLSFDAVSGLTIAGKVSEVDTLGTVSQGVVNYSVKILFESEDDRVKPGMSVSASIITALKTDTVLVPSAAVRRTGSIATVQVLNGATASDPAASSQGVTSPVPPETRTVEVGISNDQSIEILSGLKEGDQIVTRTVDPNTAVKASATTPAGGVGALRVQGLGGAAGGFTGGAGGFTGGARPVTR